MVPLRGAQLAPRKRAFPIAEDVEIEPGRGRSNFPR